ncbi:MAG: CDGSH iron-sulfur domain-containing protein, partial [Deltaproteobacteria bacterium]|nr:CDGSH iron-sulfur domain-containing protein [Deltaproteobacteria bacterium]
MTEKKVFVYDGAQADVHWDGRLCIHIGECGRAKNELFVGGREPWCQPDLVSPDQVADVVDRCPTGALSYERKGGGTGEVADAENVVSVMYNGPLYVRGDLEVDGAAEDMSGARFRVALCRCGHSKNKPFCDNSHEDAGFKDYGAVGDSGEGFDAS